MTKNKFYVNLKMNLEIKYMHLQTVSAKELRNNLPRIIESLKRGSDFTLIYRSKPVAQIRSLSSSQEGLRELLRLGKSLHFKSKKSAVELIREERD